jgi:hypothetical protein
MKYSPPKRGAKQHFFPTIILLNYVTQNNIKKLCFCQDFFIDIFGKSFYWGVYMNVYLHKETGAVIFADCFAKLLDESKKESPSMEIVKAIITKHEKMVNRGFELVNYEEAIMHVAQNILSDEQREEMQEVIDQV